MEKSIINEKGILSYIDEMNKEEIVIRFEDETSNISCAFWMERNFEDKRNDYCFKTKRFYVWLDGDYIEPGFIFRNQKCLDDITTVAKWKIEHSSILKERINNYIENFYVPFWKKQKTVSFWGKIKHYFE